MRTLRYFIAVGFAIFGAPLAHAAVDPAALVKVTPKSKAKCVEYYQYKGAMYCSTKAQNDDPPDPQVKNYEKLKIVFDDRPWQIAWGQQTPTITTVEYIPSGQDIDQWHELVTSQFIPDEENKITPQAYANLVIKNLNESGFKPDIDYLEQTPERVIFEFKIDSPKEQMQDELQMIMKGAHGLHVLHYVIKEADMGKKNREKWLQNIKASSP